MYTVCPGCTRQFQIYAEHLAAASGQVRCGFCHEQFNATERLYDEPLSNEKILNEQLAIESADEEPQFDIPESVDQNPVTPEQVVTVTNSKTDTEQELDTAISEIGIRPSVEEIKTRVKSEATAQKAVESTRESAIEEHYSFHESDELLPEESKDKSRWRWLLPLFWTTVSIVALIAIVMQLAWFNRDQILLKYPEYLTYVKQICNEFDCQLIRQQDTGAIKLVNRDVRLHPDYQDTLLVNASMKNELPVRQPYPRVQLTLFDTSGSLLGHRVFVPDDYLDSSIDIDKGMPVDSPVYFVLEVSGPTSGAVSFEFRFL
ncbi:MAG: DUF3426 domain-containing protein [Proteobacteria bacterium]|nr:DUF3426 domain-containing protein [Pseudomonadota bacterium]NOG60501.1 DUF3426 domain-containing protein [Pseudomonadota bacterium]